jgi:hypothetical protein
MITRLDHIAYRVADRNKTAEWLQKRWGLKIQTEFPITHKDGSVTKCIALEPKDKLQEAPWKCTQPIWGECPISEMGQTVPASETRFAEYHLPPEVFVSSSDDPNSIVYKWVQQRDGIGGIHHLALQVNDVYATMNQWKAEDGVKFTKDEPMTCPGLVQIFTEPHPLTGHIFELITRTDQGFCAENVGDLMESTRHLSETKVAIDHDAIERLKDIEAG